MPDPKRHAADRNIVESILRVIPGFRGYLEKEYRRDSDYLARKWLADRLHTSKRGIDDYMRRLTDNGQIDPLTQCERLRSNLDRFVSRLRGAVRGYSGLFDFVRVREDLLDEVYNHDMSLIGDVDKLAQSIEQLGSQQDSPPDVLNNLIRALDEVERKFDRRGQLLEGLGE